MTISAGLPNRFWADTFFGTKPKVFILKMVSNDKTCLSPGAQAVVWSNSIWAIWNMHIFRKSIGSKSAKQRNKWPAPFGSDSVSAELAKVNQGSYCKMKGLPKLTAFEMKS